ncbi:hypothetical protein L479_01586 [Exiguobacterium sp. S17]|nr:hypothetical protein L479_01586 [Exiguobacterium sp. S17]
MAACGPIHPRWKNETDHRIVVTYVHGNHAYNAAIRPGQTQTPFSLIDFAEVESISIEEGNKRRIFDKQVVSMMHEECGHGYACTVNYQGEGRLLVKGS